MTYLFLISFFLAFFLSFLTSYSDLFLPTHCRFRGILLHVITFNDKHTLGRTPLDEGSARRRELCLTTHNTHKTPTSMPPAGFEPTIPASERRQSHALDRTATGIGSIVMTSGIFQAFNRGLLFIIIIIIIIIIHFPYFTTVQLVLKRARVTLTKHSLFTVLPKPL